MIPSLVVAGGPTLLGVDDVDVNLTRFDHVGNAAHELDIYVPFARTDLLGELVDSNLKAKRDTVVELAWETVKWPRFRPVKSRADAAGVAVTLSGWIYNLGHAIAGIIGGAPSLNDPLPTSTSGLPTVATLGQWAVVTAPGETITLAPMDPGDASVFGTAVRFSADGPGPNYIVFTVDVPAVTGNRKVEWPGYYLLPTGLWSRNAEGLVTEIVAYDVDVGEVVDAAEWAMEGNEPSEVFLLPHPVLDVPDGKHYHLELRIHAPYGLSLIEAFNGQIQQLMSWNTAPTGQRIRDLVARASDAAYGHADTGVVVDSGSVPDGALTATRVIYDKESQFVWDMITEAALQESWWLWLDPLVDGTDKLHASTGADVVYVIDDGNAEMDGWQTQGKQADVLRVYSPDASEYTGDRLLVDFAEDAVVGPGSHEFGDEGTEVGPYGAYDAKGAYQTTAPVWRARNAALAATIKLLDLDAAVAAVAAGDLRVGNVVRDLVLGDPPYNGLAGDFRIAGVHIDWAAQLARLDLNREAAADLAGYAGGYGGGY